MMYRNGKFLGAFGSWMKDRYLSTRSAIKRLSSILKYSASWSSSAADHGKVVQLEKDLRVNLTKDMEGTKVA